MSNLADIISQKREDSDPETNSFDEEEDGYESELSQQKLPQQQQPLTRPEASTQSPASSIPTIPQRPIKKEPSSSTSPIPQPTIPKRPARSQNQPSSASASASPGLARSESPIIPPRPKKNSTASSTTTRKSEDTADELESVPDLTKSTIEKVPGVGDLVQDNTNNDAESQATESGNDDQLEAALTTPVVPSRPQKTKTTDETIVIPPRPIKKTNPVVATEGKEVSEEKEIAEDTESCFRDVSSVKDTVAEDNKEEDVRKEVDANESIGSNDEIPKEKEPGSTLNDSDIYEAEPIDTSEQIITEADAVDHAHDPVKDFVDNDKPILTEADALDQLEEVQTKREEISPVPKIPQRPSRKSTKSSTSSQIEDKEEQKLDNTISSDLPKNVDVEESTDDIISKTNEELLDMQAHLSDKKSSPSPSIPPRPTKKQSSSETITSDSNDDAKPSSTVATGASKASLSSKAPPPPVPKKPSSKIAAFQEMLKRNQEQEKQQQQQQQHSQSFKRSERTDSSDSTDRSKFRQNLNGLFALPGMARPGAPIPGILQQPDEEEEGKEEGEQREIKSDVRRSRAKGPRGKRTQKVEKVEIPDHRTIKVVEIWSSGTIKSEDGFVYEGKHKSETPAAIDDVDDVETSNPAADKEIEDEDNGDGFEVTKEETTASEAQDEIQNGDPLSSTNIGDFSKGTVKENEDSESNIDETVKEPKDYEDEDGVDDFVISPSIQSSKPDDIPDSSTRSLKSELTVEGDEKEEEDDDEEALSTPEIVDEFVDAAE